MDEESEEVINTFGWEPATVPKANVCGQCGSRCSTAQQRAAAGCQRGSWGRCRICARRTRSSGMRSSITAASAHSSSCGIAGQLRSQRQHGLLAVPEEDTSLRSQSLLPSNGRRHWRAQVPNCGTGGAAVEREPLPLQRRSSKANAGQRPGRMAATLCSAPTRTLSWRESWETTRRDVASGKRTRWQEQYLDYCANHGTTSGASELITRSSR